MKKLVFSPRQRLMEIMAYIPIVIACIVALVGCIVYRGREFATHFDLMGNVDGYGSAAVLFVMPGIMFLTSLVISLVMHLCPISMINMPFKVKPEREMLVYGTLVWVFIVMIGIMNIYALLQTILWLCQVGNMMITLLFIAALFAALIAGFGIMKKQNG